jgi:pheromone shutdown protein TraB
MLPPATGGQLLWLINAGAASAQMFADASTSDTINGVAAATGVALAAGKSITLVSPISGAWFGVLSA